LTKRAEVFNDKTSPRRWSATERELLKQFYEKVGCDYDKIRSEFDNIDIHFENAQIKNKINQPVWKAWRKDQGDPKHDRYLYNQINKKEEDSNSSDRK